MKQLLFPFLCLFGTLPLCACAPSDTAAASFSASASDAASIYVPKISGLSDSFWMGADVSSLLSLEKSGTVFYGFDGKEQDAIRTLADAGINCIRLRIWNDPYDANGHGYGGGNCDLDTAITLGLRAKQCGMQVLVDFHYSDFWADPGKQFVPKAWTDLSFEQKKQALHDYTKESLQTLIDARVPIAAVQIGNEINNGICGENTLPRIAALLSAASSAVRSVDPSIAVAVHYSNPENGRYPLYAENLEKHGVDYDVFASSYYPFWHGTLENLSSQLRTVSETYEKKVMIAETAWPYTPKDSDGHGNAIGEEASYASCYPLTVQGQSREIADVIRMMSELGDAALGVFYWEPAWIAVPAATQAERQQKWETFGSGWASSYAGEYDPNDAGQHYGGNSGDNQTLFDAEGHPLPSMKTFSLVCTGAEAVHCVDGIVPPSITAQQGETMMLPETVSAVYNTGERAEIPVVWDADALDILRDAVPGMYSVYGTAADHRILCSVEILARNRLKNHSFEAADTTMWRITERGAAGQTKYQRKSTDAHSGETALQFWHDEAVDFSLEQTVSDLPKGSYRCHAHIQGGDAGSDAKLIFYAVSDGVRYEQTFSLCGWRNWQCPEISNIPCENGSMTVGVSIQAAGNAWGTIDDFYLDLE